MSSSTPPTLAQQIVQFQDDVALVHQFTTGGADETVTTPNGDFPTLSSLVQYAHDTIRAVKTPTSETRSVGYTFTNALTVPIVHNLGTKYFTLSVFDTNGTLHIPGISDVTENGFTIQFTEAITGIVTVFLHNALVDVQERHERQYPFHEPHVDCDCSPDQ